MNGENNSKFVEVLSSEIFETQAFCKDGTPPIPETDFCNFLHIQSDTTDGTAVAVFNYSSSGQSVPTVKESGELVCRFNRNYGQLLERIYNLQEANIDPTETKKAMKELGIPIPIRK